MRRATLLGQPDQRPEDAAAYIALAKALVVRLIKIDARSTRAPGIRAAVEVYD